MRIIAIVNQKGGCGKTTTAINLAAVFARRGLRTLIVDMDPQSHCAAGLGVPEANIDFSIADALILGRVPTSGDSRLLWEVSANLDLAPSTIRLAGLEAPRGGLHELPDKDRRLARVLEHYADRYDRVLIDCPPTLGLLTFNALRASREVIIPVETGFFALRGAEKQWETIQRLIERLGRPIVCHLLPTLFDPESRLARDILDSLQRQFVGQITPTIIHLDDALREAASFGQPVIEYDPTSTASRDYDELAGWLEANEPGAEVEVQVTRQPSIPGPARRPIPAPVTSHADLTMMQAMSGSGSGTGGRAAELARRVRDLALLQQEAGPENDITLSTPVSTPTVPPVPMPTAGTTAPVAVATAPAASAVTEIDAVPTTDREAAEQLAARLSLLSMQSTLGVDADPTVAESVTPVRRAPSPASALGARITSDGVLFVQPGSAGRRIAIAGEFNQWSATATPLTYNSHLGVHEARVPIPPGRYQYRLVVDGRWQADPHNPAGVTNAYGEPNSVIEVTAARGVAS